MTKTMSIRMDKENFEFVSQLSKQGKGDISKTVRDLIYKGRVLLAIEKYKNGEASLGKAADLAGLCIGDMMTTLEQYGVKSNLEVQDYLEGLDNLKKVW